MGKFNKGDVPWNKGLSGFNPSPQTQFKSGENHVGENHPSWKGGVQVVKNDCVHVWIGNKERQRRPKVIWEKTNGKLPKGYVLYHIDGDRYNDDISNLEAITRAELLKRNRKTKSNV